MMRLLSIGAGLPTAPKSRTQVCGRPRSGDLRPSREGTVGVVSRRRLVVGIWRFVGIWRCLLLSLILSGCALSAPPPSRGNAPILTPLPPQTDVALELPARKPSVANGAALYAEKCVSCHGASGAGDGDKAADILAQFGAAPADLTADSVARASTPAEWFGVITAGRLERGMPPFSGSLVVDDRWDVMAYVWSLGSPESKLTTGQAIYAERCVQCHGETGAGNGSQAEGNVPDLSTLDAYRDVAPGEWDNALQSTHVPSFSGKLNSFERSAVIDYLRSFTYDTSAVVAEPPPVTPGSDATTPPPDTSASGDGSASGDASYTINGSLVSGTAGSPPPVNIDVTFYHFPGGLDHAPITQTLKTDAEGRFQAPDLKAQPGDVVAVNVTPQDVTYWSEAVTLDETSNTLDLPLPVYAQTTATDAIRIKTLHLIAAQNSGALDVTEIYVLSNLGDRTVANTSGATLHFTLPAGATAFRDMNDTPGVFVQTPDGFDYREAVLPGDEAAQFVIAYQLPLDAEASLSRIPTYPMNSINLLVQAGDLQASSDQLTNQGVRSFEGAAYEIFSGQALPAGQPLTFRLARANAGIDAKLVGGIALLVVGVAAVGYGVWRTRPRKTPPPPRSTLRKQARTALAGREQLLDQIAALDDAFEARDLPEAEYRKRREALKAKLLRAMR